MVEKMGSWGEMVVPRTIVVIEDELRQPGNWKELNVLSFGLDLYGGYS